MDVPLFLVIGLLLAQGPGDGWWLVPGVRQVDNLYYELFNTTEIWVCLIPEDPAGKPSLPTLVFKAFFPGRLPYRGDDKRTLEAKGPPSRLLLQAQPGPLTMIKGLPTLRIVIDGKAVDLLGSDAPYRYLYPCPNCRANGVEVELAPSILHSLITARSVTGEALGFPMKLTAEDQQALAQFEARSGLAGEKKRDP